MKRLLTSSAAIAAVMLSIGAGTAATLGRSPLGAWVPTATGVLPVRNARAMGLAPASLPMHLVIGLQMRDRAGAQALLRRENTRGDALYRTAISPEQFTALFNPTHLQVSAVTGYLASHGFRNIVVEPNNLIVSANGTAAQASAAFNTSIGAFQQNGRMVYANTRPANVPAVLRGTIISVLGLSNADEATMHAAKRVVYNHPAPSYTPQPCNPGPICITATYGPQDFQKYYDAAGTPDGHAMAIAVFAEGNVAQVVKDLRSYEQNFKLPQVLYTVRKVGISSPDTAGLDEWDLDTQTSTGMANNVSHLFVYDTTSLTDSDIALEFSKFVTDDKALAGNASFGTCETFAQTDGSEVLDDENFLQAAAQGQTVFSSTGDNGNGCPLVAAVGAPGLSLPENSYPATSPYVVGVGGTTIVSAGPGNPYSSEITWIGTGGGVSQTEIAPSWQAGPVGPIYVAVGRTLPDISMDGDPNTGALIYVSGAQTGVGGTSLSSPLSMGVWARLNGPRKGKLGFAAPLLYQAWEAYVPNCSPTVCIPPTPAPGATTQLIGGFHDILLGSNGGPYGTLPGYDLETGLGTFDVSLMNTAIKKVVGF